MYFNGLRGCIVAFRLSLRVKSLLMVREMQFSLVSMLKVLFPTCLTLKPIQSWHFHGMEPRHRVDTCLSMHQMVRYYGLHMPMAHLGITLQVWRLILVIIRWLAVAFFHVRHLAQFTSLMPEGVILEHSTVSRDHLFTSSRVLVH